MLPAPSDLLLQASLANLLLLWFPGALLAQDPRLVADLAPGGATSSAQPLGASGRPGEILVAIDDGVRGNELWRSDGTAAGTSLLVELVPGAGGANFTWSGSDARECWFVVDRGQGHELWRSDGTPLGTRMVFAAASIGAMALTSVGVSTRIGNRFLLGADGHTWISDGTVAGTQSLGIGAVTPSLVRGNTWYAADASTLRVHEITPGSPPTVVTHPDSILTSVAGEPVLVQYGFVLFPVPALTTTLRALGRPFVPPVGPVIGELFCFDVNGAMVFADQFGGLWRWDLANPAVVIASNVAPPQGSSFQPVGSRLMYVSVDPGTGTEPCLTDGTALGTQVLDLTQGPASTAFSFAGEIGKTGRGLLWIDSPATGYEPWATDGTVSGTQMLGDLEPGVQGSAVSWTGFGGAVGQRRLVANVRTQSRGFELWVTDGTPSGSRQLAEVRPGPTDGLSATLPFVPFPAGHRLVFGADDAVHGFELWAADLEGSTTAILAQGSRAFAVIGDAVLGAQVAFASEGLQPTDLGAVAIGLPAPSAQAIGANGTSLLVDLARALPLLLIAPNAQGAWSQSVIVPNDASLQGLELVAQAAFAGPAIPGGVEFAKAYWLCLGR